MRPFGILGARFTQVCKGASTIASRCAGVVSLSARCGVLDIQHMAQFSGLRICLPRLPGVLTSMLPSSRERRGEVVSSVTFSKPWFSSCKQKASGFEIWYCPRRNRHAIAEGLFVLGPACLPACLTSRSRRCWYVHTIESYPRPTLKPPAGSTRDYGSSTSYVFKGAVGNIQESRCSMQGPRTRYMNCTCAWRCAAVLQAGVPTRTFAGQCFVTVRLFFSRPPRRLRLRLFVSRTYRL